ncbi:MAG TPA: hypothetical protein VIY48_12960 [Candidatus Paceibacterota bacterium]
MPAPPVVNGIHGPVGVRPAQKIPVPPKPAGPAPKSSYINTGNATIPVTNANQGQVRAMQLFLNTRGYKIAVDGVRGPQTNAAVAAFHNHVAPQAFNAKHGTAGPRSGGPGAHGNGAGVNVGGNAGAGVGVGTGGAQKRSGAATAPTAPAASTSDPSIPPIDPVAYARGAANSEFDPQINDLLQQIGLAPKQYGRNQKDITDWYAQLEALRSKYAGLDQSNVDKAIGGYDTAANNSIGELFGGGGANPAAGEAAAYHDINRAGLQGLANNENDFNAQLGDIFKAQAADAHTRQTAVYDALAQQLASKLSDLRGAKGAKYSQELATGTQMASQQQAASQSLALAKSLAPSQIAVAQANATKAKAEAGSAAAVADANLKLLKANLKKAQASAGGWNLQSDPSQVGQLANALRQSVQLKGGTFRIQPGAAWDNLKSALQMYGLAGNPQAVQMAIQVMQETMNNSHAKKMWGEYNFDPNTGTVKKNGTPFKSASKK